jgi:hypothetical protein
MSEDRARSTRFHYPIIWREYREAATSDKALYVNQTGVILAPLWYTGHVEGVVNGAAGYRLEGCRQCFDSAEESHYPQKQYCRKIAKNKKRPLL